MNVYLILLLVALIPAIILCGYIFHKDRVEKEPIPFLLLLLFLGALCATPVLIVSDPVNALIDVFFSLFGRVEGDEIVLGPIMTEIYILCSNTIGVGLIEEGFKWLFLFLATRNSKYFNSLFDGVIYAVFVSLGFAAFENILYTFSNGLSVGILRAFTAVPGHMFFGIIMGYYYTLWNVYNEASKLEVFYGQKGMITVKSKLSGNIYLALSVIFPVLVHGFYDYLCTHNSVISTAIFYLFLLVLYVTQFRRVKKLSDIDTSKLSVAQGILFRKYPDLPLIIAELAKRAIEESQVQNTQTAGE